VATVTSITIFHTSAYLYLSCLNEAMSTMTPLQYKKIERKKPGPKPKKISERHAYAAKIKPVKRPEKAWSQAQKIRVLTYLHHTQIPITPTIYLSTTELFRSPTQTEASENFGIPQRTISEWVKNKENIEDLGGGKHTNICTSKSKDMSKWPEMESKLYERFIEKREKGQAIRREWFRRHAMEIFMAVYPNADTGIFMFSNGWFGGFLGRYRISFRAITKKAQKASNILFFYIYQSFIQNTN